MGERIAAIVISHNRMAETQGCIDALRHQTRLPDQIIVVDNGSTDSSRAWLSAQQDIHLITQANLGTSGALRNGLEYAVTNDYDWAWCFDDDAHPAPDALRVLVEAMRVRPDARVLNSISLSRTHPDRFAVGALHVRTAENNYLAGARAETLADILPFTDAQGMVDSIGGHFYHGLLLHRQVIQTAGRPLPWLFTWGDESEYGYRIMRAGFHIYSVVGSVVYHPEIPFASLSAFGKRKVFEIRPPRPRYYFIRNSLWVHRHYFQSSLLPFVARRLGGALLAELVVIPNKSLRSRLASCAAALRGVRDGLKLQPARDANGNPILV